MTRAQRLAREARLRERDSREALARAREALEGGAYVPAISPDRRMPRTRSAPTAQWQRHPLAPAPTKPVRISPIPDAPAPIAAQSAVPVALRIAVPAAERALSAELREARATLSIARETTQVQRDEIARLRLALAQAVSVPEATAEPASESTELLEPLTRLRERVQQLEIDLDHRERERAQLIEALAAGEREQAERARQLAALQDRFDVQERALEQSRRQSEQERRRHTEAQATLDRLRTALRGLEGEAAPAPEDEPRDDQTIVPAAAARVESSEPIPTAGSSITIVNTAATATPNAAPASTATAMPTIACEPITATPNTGGLFRTPIFERWRESQIRRHFGPLGFETTGDLLRDPLVRRKQGGGQGLAILLLGAGAAGQSQALVEDLTRKSTPRFVLHVADPLAPSAAELPAVDSLGETQRLHRAPESAGEFERLVRELKPAVIVLRDFLTAEREVETWLEVLRRASDAGACLVLLEETGRGHVVPGDEIDAIGQRIWELLPERYTRDPVTEAPVASYREAFARRVTPPRNGLLGALRSRFELELCAQFGFLAEAFVSGPIAGCFDAEAARDRRFLEQITDLDDRRVEAGSTTALHLIARIDPLAPR